MVKSCNQCGENNFIMKPFKDGRKFLVLCKFCGHEMGLLNENFNESLFELLKKSEEKNERQRKIIDDLIKAGSSI